MWRPGATEIVDSICIAMFVLGTIGNSLGLIVFSSRKFRRTTYGRLAIASLVINLLCVFRYSLLLHSGARLWLTYRVGQSWFNCKLYRLSSCLRVLSALVIVAWTYERFTYVAVNYRLFTNRPLVNKYKFYFMAAISLVIVVVLTGPTVYFNRPVLKIYTKDQQSAAPTFRTIDASHRENSPNEEFSTLQPAYRTACDLPESTASYWRTFFNDVRFGFNYTTLRSILSEVIPSLFVMLFDIGIIIHVVLSTSSILSNGPLPNARSQCRASLQSKDLADGLIVHNRPRTSWMNIVLIMHSFLFCFSSLTATIVHWSTSNFLLSYSASVVILANCSLNFYVYCLSGRSFRNEIRKLLYRYFQLYCFGGFLNLFRTKSQRDQVTQVLRLRLARHRSTTTNPAQSTGHFRRISFGPVNN